MSENDSLAGADGELVPFGRWLASMGKTRATGWNYRKKGVVKCVNVFGSVYITRREIQRFEARAAAGEFALKRGRAAREKKEKLEALAT